MSWDNEYREKSGFSVFCWVIIEDSFVYILDGLKSRSISTLMIDSFFELCEFVEEKSVWCERDRIQLDREWVFDAQVRYR